MHTHKKKECFFRKRGASTEHTGPHSVLSIVRKAASTETTFLPDMILCFRVILSRKLLIFKEISISTFRFPILSTFFFGKTRTLMASEKKKD